MRILSLFSGIGGLELGLEWAGVGHTVAQVEQDAFCRQILARHWPDVPRFDDVRTVGVHNLPACDVICGGFPCQDISYANTSGTGLAGSRSGLFYEYVRIIGEMAPRFAVVENVPALFTRGFGDVLGSLADIGYDAEWDVVSAQSVGARHKRERIFLIAFGVANSERGRRGGEPRRGSGEIAEDGHSQLEEGAGTPLVADTSGFRGQARVAGSLAGEGGESGEPVHDSAKGRVRRPIDGWWTTEPAVGRVAYGVPHRVHRLRALGNAVVPQVAEVVGRRLLALDAELRGAA